jgi:hypothetical protein
VRGVQQAAQEQAGERPQQDAVDQRQIAEPVREVAAGRHHADHAVA